MPSLSISWKRLVGIDIDAISLWNYSSFIWFNLLRAIVLYPLFSRLYETNYVYTELDYWSSVLKIATLKYLRVEEPSHNGGPLQNTSHSQGSASIAEEGVQRLRDRDQGVCCETVSSSSIRSLANRTVSSWAEQGRHHWTHRNGHRETDEASTLHTELKATKEGWGGRK